MFLKYILSYLSYIILKKNSSENKLVLLVDDLTKEKKYSSDTKIRNITDIIGIIIIQ